MNTHLVSYATADFRLSIERLADSARQNGIGHIHLLHEREFRKTGFYRSSQAILSQSRGSGYWLWKPYLISKTLDEIGDGDILIYADAGIAILRSLEPLFQLCLPRGMLLFAGHYDDINEQPHVCGSWSKRDCFVLMDCDAPDYHDAQMIDASFMVFLNVERSRQFVQQWLELCLDARLLTDGPNTCGLDNLPGFVSHRHDQSIVSILAARCGIELFRSPSQHGNHCKSEDQRENGEWTRGPYGSSRTYSNSPYGTLLFHHRAKAHDLASVLRRLGNDLRVLDAGTGDLAALEHSSIQEVLALAGLPLCEDAAPSLSGAPFQVILLPGHDSAQVLADLRCILDAELLDPERFAMCWTRLDHDLAGWIAFRVAKSTLWQHFGPRVALSFYYGFAPALNTPADMRIVGIACGLTAHP